jgi:hypothetical protein
MHAYEEINKTSHMMLKLVSVPGLLSRVNTLVRSYYIAKYHKTAKKEIGRDWQM